MFERAAIEANGLPRTVDPSTIALVSYVKNNDIRIRNYLYTLQNRVKSEHILIQIFAALVYMGDGSYDSVEWHCKRKLPFIGNALRLTSSNSYGQLHRGQFLPFQDEIISLVARPIDPKQDWRSIETAKYLWHDFTNLNWELGENNPRGITIIEINLVALLWVHIKAREYYRAEDRPINEPVMVQRHMITPMLSSYMNIAFFNHHRYRAKGIVPTRDIKYAEFPRPELYQLAVRGAREKQSVFLAQLFTPVEMLNNIPQPFTELGEFGNARRLVQFSLPGETLQGSWHYNLVNWQLALFCFRYNRGLMEKYYSGLRFELLAFHNSRVLEKFPTAMRMHYQMTLIEPLKKIVGDF